MAGAAQGKLTQGRRRFARRIRALGHVTSHDAQTVDDNHTDDLVRFTRLFLMQMFTPPGMLPKADARA